MAGIDAGFVLRPGEGRRIDLGSLSMCVKATAAVTGGSFSLLEADEPPDFGPPMHIHHDAAEAFYVLKGEYRIFVEAEEWQCPAGSFIYIPAGVTHGFRVGRTAGSKLNLYLPAAMIGYFDELSEALSSGGQDPERVERIAGRYSMEVVGEVPSNYA